MRRESPTPGCKCATCKRLRAYDKWRAGQDPKRLREEYAVLNGLDTDTAAQITRLAEQDAIECANRILERYATERPPAP